MNKGQGQDLGEGSLEDEGLGIRGEKLPTTPESLPRERAEQAVPGSKGPHSYPNLTVRSRVQEHPGSSLCPCRVQCRGDPALRRGELRD